MLHFAENELVNSIGTFGLGSVMRESSRRRSWIEINPGSINSAILPGQCQAFLTSPRKFVWFIEQWDISGPLATLENKKIYPAKVNGLNLPLVGTSDIPTPVTVRWREGLIRYGSYYANGYGIGSDLIPCLRPGFGQVIPSDLQRPFQAETIMTNNLGLTGATANSPEFWGPLGALMSMAFHVDEKIAAKYDASTSKKKKKSLNSQDYEQMPTYPPYTPYVDNSGY